MSIIIIIIGAGPNLGAAIARRFGREGMSVGLVSRNPEKLELLTEELAQDGITADFAPADIRDATALSSAIGSLADRLGAIEVLEYSPVPAGEYMKPVLETTVDDVRAALEFSVLGAVAAVTSVIGPMLERGSGTILFTTGGAGDQPQPGPYGRRDLLRRRGDLRPDAPRPTSRSGHPCRHTAIGGSIAPDGDHHPDDVADLLWRHHAQRGDFHDSASTSRSTSRPDRTSDGVPTRVVTPQRWTCDQGAQRLELRAAASSALVDVECRGHFSSEAAVCSPPKAPRTSVLGHEVAGVGAL
jgi:NAD(P)-dependent dehydrogenase (short-subunit alcohol dehydrogenase family)